MRVSVCIITYQRPEGLQRLLESLAGLTFARLPWPSLQVIIVDNDADGSARFVAKAAATFLSYPVLYHVESKRGIPIARNTALALAGNSDFIVFIDDDEIASPTWLEELLAVQSRYAADVVGGPVLPHFEVEPPAWILDGRFFEYPRHPTGMTVRYVTCGNLLIAQKCMQRTSKMFDESLTLTGGEDTYLSIRLQQQGRKVVWADEARVEEFVPISRMNSWWLLQRAYRYGNSLVLCFRLVGPQRFWWVTRIIKGVSRLGRGALLLLLCVFCGRAMLIRSLADISRGFGVFTGLLGIRYEEYKQTHGT